MNNLENLRNFLNTHNPKGGLKTFNFTSIEKKLEIPNKTLEHFTRGNRGLGANETKVLEHFRNLGFQQHLEIGSYAINKGEKISIQETQSGEYAEFDQALFETNIRKFFTNNF